MLLMSNCFKIFFYLNTTLELRRKHCNDALRCPAVPQMRAATPLAFSTKNPGNLGDYSCRVCPDEYVRALLNGDGPFSIFADRHARNTQCSSFLLKTSAIGQHYCRILPQIEETHIRLRACQDNIGPQVDAKS